MKPAILFTAALLSITPQLLAEDAPAPAPPKPLQIPAPPPSPKTYPIRLDRPLAAGSKFKIVASATVRQNSVILAKGREIPAPDDAGLELGLQFQAVARIDAVDPAGRPTKVSYKVDRCVVQTRDAASRPVDKVAVEPGQNLIAKLGEQSTTFEVDNKPVDEQANVLLQTALSLNTGKSDEQTYGSTRGRLPGESWPLDPNRAAASLAERGLTVNPANVRGSTTLAAPQDYNGVPAALIKIEMSAAALKFPPGADVGPAGFKTDHASLAATMSAVYPLDLEQPRLTESRSMTMDTYFFRGAAGGDRTQLRQRMQRAMTLERTPVTEKK
jgi:hypothetical protein